MTKPPERFAPEWDGFLRSIAYDFDKKAGRLILAPGRYCDRACAVELFRAIDPEVRRIEIYFIDDKQRCACFVRHESVRCKNGFWRALAGWHRGEKMITYTRARAARRNNPRRATAKLRSHFEA